MSAAPLVQTQATETADPPAEPPLRATLLNVQALRALAAFMVVCVHIQALALMAGAPAKVTEAGNAGVDLFFVISGFIMVFTTGRKPMGPAAFFGARLRRIAPLYWSMTLAVFLVARLAPSLVQNTPTDIGRLVASILFVPELRPDGTMRPVVFVGWTLNFEMAFYVLFALGLFAPRRWLGVVGTVAAPRALTHRQRIAQPCRSSIRQAATITPAGRPKAISRSRLGHSSGPPSIRAKAATPARTRGHFAQGGGFNRGQARPSSMPSANSSAMGWV